MSVKLLTPFTTVSRRSAPMPSDGDDILTGRWAIVDENGEVVPVGTEAGKPGAYLVLEGNVSHKGSGADFDGTTKESTDSFELPSVVQSHEIALAYGVFRYEVGPEGFNNSAIPDAGDLVTTDAYGRLVATTGGDEIAKVEAITTDDDGVVTAVVRTLGK